MVTAHPCRDDDAVVHRATDRVRTGTRETE